MRAYMFYILDLADYRFIFYSRKPIIAKTIEEAEQMAIDETLTTLNPPPAEERLWVLLEDKGPIPQQGLVEYQ